MATTNKSTKAKTKKPAARAAKTTKKSVSTKVSKPVAQKAANKLLTQLNILSAALALISAVLAGLLMNNRTFELVNGLLTNDELGKVAVPAVRHVYDLELRMAVIVIMVLSAVTPILFLTSKKSEYAAAIKNKVNLLRWIDAAVVGALMIEVVALVSGVQDVSVLKLIAGLVVVTCLLGWVAEKRNKQAGRPTWNELAISLATGVLPWVLIASYAVSTWVHGRIHSPAYVYVLYAGVVLGSVAYGMNLINYVRRLKSSLNYEVVERNYLIIGMATKAVFAIALIVGLQK